MSRSFIQPGDTLSLGAPYDVAAGAMFKVGLILAVAAATALSGAAVEGRTTGVHTGIAKVGSQAWAVGDLVYWDDANKRLTKTATGATLAGVALEVVASGAGDIVAGAVRLNGAFRPTEA